jgi:hypothetical protein
MQSRLDSRRFQAPKIRQPCWRRTSPLVLLFGFVPHCAPYWITRSRPVPPPPSPCLLFNVVVPINTIYSCTFVPTPDLCSPLADLRARTFPCSFGPFHLAATPDDMRVPQWTRLPASVSLGLRSSTAMNLLLLPPFPYAHHVRTPSRSLASQAEVSSNTLRTGLPLRFTCIKGR